MDVNDPAIKKHWADNDYTDEQLAQLAEKIDDQNLKLDAAIQRMASIQVTARSI
jgi:hypothetical protein